MKKLIISSLICLLSVGLLAEKRLPATTTLHDFMEDYTKSAMKHFKKTGDRGQLNRLLPEFPALTITEQRKDWQKIVDQALAEGKPEKSCKTCHDIYKKDYKKIYRKREIQVPAWLLE